MNNDQLAEFIGIILGDGHIHTKENKITIVGSLEEYDYYTYIISPLIKELFDVSPRLLYRNDSNAIYLYFHSKKALNLLVNELGMKRGNKTHAVIPSFVKSQNLHCSFFRGLFDTDGCLKFSKQGKTIHYYPRIQFCFKESLLSRELLSLLREHNFPVGSWKDNRFENTLHLFQISGVKNTDRWMREIGTHNMVQGSKYLIWKKTGAYVPRSSLKERLQALNLNMGDKSSYLAYVDSIRRPH